MKKRWVRILFAVSLITACAMPLASQEPPPLVQVVRFHVKPDKVGEFRDIQARFTAASKEAGRLYRGVWRNRNNGSEYGVVTPRENYASYDSPPAAGPSRTIPEAEFQRLVARLQQCYDDRDVVIYRDIPELTNRPATPPNMVVTNTVTIRPGTQAKFLELRKQLFDQYKKLGAPAYGLRQVQFGGSRLAYMMWTGVDKMADLDGQSRIAKAFEAMGEAAASKWREENSRVVTSNELDIYVFEPDLSHYSAP